MESINNYTPEYVTRFSQYSDSCQCPACKKTAHHSIQSSIRWKIGRGEKLSLTCETVCSKALFNPQAFNLQVTKKPPQTNDNLPLWEKTINQQCFNLSANPHLQLEESLFAIGVFISKIQSVDKNANDAVESLNKMAEDLILLAKNGILQQQIAMLPSIPKLQRDTLKQLGKQKLQLNFSSAKKVSFMINLTEIALLTTHQLDERYKTLKLIWRNSARPFFDVNSYILKNYLLYCLYQQPFCNELTKSLAQQFLEITKNIFNLKILSSILILSNETINQDDVVKIISAYSAIVDSTLDFALSSSSTFNNMGNKDDEILASFALIAIA